MFSLNKTIKALILSLCALPTALHAYQFEVETLRTKESPGFFALRIYPDPTAKTLPTQDVFIRNFAAENEAHYEEILNILSESGAVVIDKSELTSEVYLQENIRLIILGEPEGNLLHFEAPPEGGLEAFEIFSQEFLTPVLFQDITLDFGGNISDVYTDTQQFWGPNEIFIIGKFRRPMRTYSRIKGLSAHGEFLATSIIDLRKSHPDPLSERLPEIWEQFAFPPQSQEPHDIQWLFIFPWIIGIVGLSFIGLAFANRRPHRKKSILDQLPDEPTTKEPLTHLDENQRDQAAQVYTNPNTVPTPPVPTPPAPQKTLASRKDQRTSNRPERSNKPKKKTFPPDLPTQKSPKPPSFHPRPEPNAQRNHPSTPSQNPKPPQNQRQIH